MSYTPESKKLPVLLVILDGWGFYQDYQGNAITQANPTTFNHLWQNYPHTLLSASGKDVGLPPQQDGNSESGHLNLGAGRIVEQDTVKISKAISTGTFFKNPAFKEVVKHLKQNKSQLHLVGLLSGWQSAHSDPDHLLALITLFRQYKIKKVFLHLFTDGRDSYQYGALDFLKKLRNELDNGEKIATIIGRYYAMDRKKKWARTAKTYNALVLGQAKYYAKSAEQAIAAAYERGETDEFISPTVIVEHIKNKKDDLSVTGTPVTTIQDNDAIVFFNLRSDRARQLSKAFVQKNFNTKNKSAFRRKKVLKNLCFVAMTDFGPDLDSILSAFPSEDIRLTLPAVLKDKRQLYIAENEKYAHVTYFFNGGYAKPVGGEHRKKIPSPDVAHYDLQPEMSSMLVTDEVVKNLKNKKYDFITVNFANPDMVGHTGNLTAGIKACQSVDRCLAKILKQIKEDKGLLIVTADHGNVEEMIDQKTGEVDTQHSSYPVPFIIVDHRLHKPLMYKLKKDGILANVAPTILDLMHIKKPRQMTGESLIIK